MSAPTASSTKQAQRKTDDDFWTPDKTEDLILIVQARPYLYNAQVSNYKDSQNRFDTWATIGVHFDISGEYLQGFRDAKLCIRYRALNYNQPRFERVRGVFARCATCTLVGYTHECTWSFKWARV